MERQGRGRQKGNFPRRENLIACGWTQLNHTHFRGLKTEHCGLSCVPTKAVAHLHFPLNNMCCKRTVLACTITFFVVYSDQSANKRATYSVIFRVHVHSTTCHNLQLNEYNLDENVFPPRVHKNGWEGVYALVTHMQLSFSYIPLPFLLICPVSEI